MDILLSRNQSQRDENSGYFRLFNIINLQYYQIAYQDKKYNKDQTKNRILKIQGTKILVSTKLILTKLF